MMDCMDKQRIAPSPGEPVSRTPLIIAVDGPAASGKGTLARRLAAHFGLPYLDTGKLYRAVGWKVLEQGHSPEEMEAAIQAAKTLDPASIDAENLLDEKVGNAASIVSAMPQVRNALLDLQRKFAYQPQGSVLDGRDIGTVICPDATVKLFVTARLDARAKRRFSELRNNGMPVTLEEVAANLQARDQRDAARQIAPLLPAVDAWQIDTSDMGVDEVLEVVLAKMDIILHHQS